tara:strand:- start:2050 stop:3357 length:1308 start_codon:yes stop_codon:yes gene_type:complete
MRFISSNIKLVFIILFLSVSSCSDKDLKPFVGQKIDIHISSRSEVSKDFNVKIDRVTRNDYWVQKGGFDTHSIPNLYLKFPLKIIFSKNTDQEISDEYFSLANPVVDKKNIYLISTNGQVTSIDKKDFKINWIKQIFSDEVDFPNAGSIVVKLNGDDLYLHNGGNFIYALNKKDGEVKWKFKNKFPFRGNISIKNDYLLVNDYNNNLLSFLEKKLIWKKKLGQSENAILSNIRPIIYENKIINPAFNGLFHILNINDGKLIFSDYLQPNKNMAKIFRNNDIIANPIISDEKLYIISHSGTLASYDLNNLKLLWSVQIGGGNTPILSGNSIFLIDNNNILYAINANNGKIKWRKQFNLNIEEGFYFKEIKKINFKGPFLIDNKLMLFSSNGYLNLLDPLSGKLLESLDFDLLGAEPIFVENKLIILTSDGDLKVYK